jgi:iron-sulfur cluster assembly accessory protein
MQKNHYPSESDLDKWFAELEAELEAHKDEDELARLSQKVLERQKPSLEDKILQDFHGHAPIIDESYSGQLPDITPKAKIFITQNLEEGQYFRFGVTGGGCSGFNYGFDVDTEVRDEDVQFSDSPPAVVDRESLKFLYGTIIDLEDKGMNKLLKVNNPGAKASCGCGTSFAFDEDLLDIY